ncbi:ATP-binding protein [Streptomyces antarcticus]|uniref:ATP-binding protein n=1 Tax=Streptomyces antarcticus TaxID=2996458 RepID=UPI00226FE5E6|nr:MULTISPECIES: ATP-binding protein [unclassified Streptomyces]MCY0940475.1 ATP-binding protein [Streptomyces sp. H34-AA3]MCZ4082406.1 ATP-binding protein [Streptomyces sp. H34-S5]
MTWQWIGQGGLDRPDVDETAEVTEPDTTPLPRPLSLSAAFEGSEPIARARLLARSFLDDVQRVHGLRVSDRVLDLVELFVSELVTNTRKYAPGPSLLTLHVWNGCVDVTVWDSNPALPAILPPDPTRVGQHGLEIVKASARTFQVRREPVGKRITVSLPLTDDPATNAAGG